jgi:methylglyoxal synthase
MGNTMRKFVMAHKHLLSKFMILGDKRTMAMIRSIYSSQDGSQHGRKHVNQRPWEEDDIRSDYAKFSTLMDEGRIGGVILFEDPHVDSIHYDPDLDRLCELSLLKNVTVLNNPTTALVVMNTLRLALKEGRGELIPSFFFPLQHPSVLGSASSQVLDTEVQNIPIPIPIPIQASTEYTRDRENELQLQEQRYQVEELNQKVLAMNEENKRLKFALATAERQLHEGRNELTSIVEGIMDVDTEVAALLLKQIQAQNRIVQSQDRDRESPLTVTDEILKSQLQNVDSNDGPSHSHSSASADTPERSFKSRLEKVSETFFFETVEWWRRFGFQLGRYFNTNTSCSFGP